MEPPENNHLSDRDFDRLAAFIRAELGIKMPPQKRVMLELRLGSRLRALGMDSFERYCEHVFDGQGAADELSRLVDAVTTNKTEFFREPAHFEQLTGEVLPQLLRGDNTLGHGRPLRIWSAGCSSGEEPYTLAMALAEHALQVGGFDFEITATDVSSRVIEIARTAVYKEQAAQLVPAHMRDRSLLRARNPSKNVIRVAPAIRRRVRFGRLNLIEPFRFAMLFDVVFCRNVLIYFARDTQLDVLGRICETMVENGYLFIGHSETLHGMRLPLRYVAPTIYIKDRQSMT